MSQLLVRLEVNSLQFIRIKAQSKQVDIGPDIYLCKFVGLKVKLGQIYVPTQINTHYLIVSEDQFYQIDILSQVNGCQEVGPEI